MEGGPRMAEQLCPACGCTIGDEAYEEEGVIYCYESCALESSVNVVVARSPKSKNSKI